MNESGQCDAGSCRTGRPATLRPVRERLDPVGPAGRAEQQHRLARRDEPLGATLAESAAWLFQLECAEHLLAEVAVFAGGIFLFRPGHWRHPSRTGCARSAAIPQIAGILIHNSATSPAFCGGSPILGGASSSPGCLMHHPRISLLSEEGSGPGPRVRNRGFR